MTKPSMTSSWSSVASTSLNGTATTVSPPAGVAAA